MGTIWRALMFAAWACASLAVVSTAADAQSTIDMDSPDAEPAAPAYAVRVEGDARLLRDGQVDELAPGLPLDEGDQLNTGLGRLEWRRDGAESIFLDRHSAVVVSGQRLTRLDIGTLVVTLPAETGEAPYRVDTPTASVRLGWPGRYRLEVRAGGETTVTTWRGRAAVQAVTGEQSVGSGERLVVLPGAAPELFGDVNIAVLDAFDRWVEASPVTDHNDAYAEDLPRSLSSYGPVLAQHGRWRTDATYGRVWYPNVVPDWRPYAGGRWHRARRFGYVWIGADSWSWPTHHYGRWQMTGGGRWFWIPAARWSAAHVYWAVAPGYVAWAPLGWNGRPQVDFRVGLDYYSSGGFGASSAFVSRGGYDPWNVWTVMPATSLDHRGPVAASRLHRAHFNHVNRVPFVMTPRLPLVRGRVFDSSTPSDRAVPRDRSWAGPANRPQSPGTMADRLRSSGRRNADPRAFGAPRRDSDPHARAERARRQRWPGDASGATGPVALGQPRDARATDESGPARTRPSAPPSAPRGQDAGDPSSDRPRPAGVRPRAPFAPRTARSGATRSPGSDSRTNERAAPPSSNHSGQAIPRGEGARRPRN